MKICIFGATGKTGKFVVTQALERGHELIVTTRDTEKTPDIFTSDRIEVRECDVTKEAQVENAVVGAEAVISVLGHGPKTLPRMQTTGTKHIIQAMKTEGIKRIISLTGVGVHHKKDDRSQISEWPTRFVQLIRPDMIADGRRAAQVLYDSGLDWTLIRAQKLTMGNRSSYEAGYISAGLFATASRSNIADFALNCLERNEWIQEAPIIINT